MLDAPTHQSGGRTQRDCRSKTKEAPFGLNSQCTEVSPNACRPVTADLLEVKGRMTGVRFEERKVVVGQRSDGIRKLLVAVPECGACSMES